MPPNHLLPWSICFLTLLALAPAHSLSPYPALIQGQVLCQDCQRMMYGSQVATMTARNPIEGAFVAVKCFNNARRVVKFAVGKTNKFGVFSIALHDFIQPLKNCKATLLSSPLKGCNVKTRLNEGLSGATPVFKQKISANPVYVVGPFAFIPYYCKSVRP